MTKTKAGQAPRVSYTDPYTDDVVSEYVLEDGDVIEVRKEAQRFYNAPDCKKHTVWRIRDGKPIVMFKFGTWAMTCDVPVVSSIEVRMGYRGNGLGAATVNAVSELLGYTIHSSGSYTPKGNRSLNGKIPMRPFTPNQYAWDEGPGVKWRDMIFVEDWDNKWSS